MAVAATDSHNSNPGDVEEWDYRGSAGTAQSPAMRRLRQGDPDNKAYRSSLKFNTSGGLAAVWAPENTREAIFDALARLKPMPPPVRASHSAFMPVGTLMKR